MEDNVIKDGNRLIANFLNPDYAGEFEYALQWHRNWEWLMPLVEKIEKIDTGYEISIIDKECEIGTMGYQYTCVARGKEDTKILAVWRACVEFIKWYNDEQKKIL